MFAVVLLTLSNMFLLTKVFGSLLPALIFTQLYAWAFMNVGAIYAFFIIWVILVFKFYKINNRDELCSKVFSYASIGAYLMPLFIIISNANIGSELMAETASDEFAQVGAAIGVGLASTMALIISLVVGITFGFIFGKISNSYKEKI